MTSCRSLGMALLASLACGALGGCAHDVSLGRQSLEPGTGGNLDPSSTPAAGAEPTEAGTGTSTVTETDDGLEHEATDAEDEPEDGAVPDQDEAQSDPSTDGSGEAQDVPDEPARRRTSPTRPASPAKIPRRTALPRGRAVPAALAAAERRAGRAARVACRPPSVARVAAPRVA